MERDYSLASLLGGLAGIVGAVFLASLVLAAPHLGDVDLTDGGWNGHPAGLPHRSDGGRRTHGAKSDCAERCASPVSDLGDGGEVFVPPQTPDEEPDGIRRNRGALPDVTAAFDDPHENSRAPWYFTGGGGIPSAFLGGNPPTVTGAPPPASSPEPGAWALLLLGLGAVGAARRSCRRPAGTPS